MTQRFLQKYNSLKLNDSCFKAILSTFIDWKREKWSFSWTLSQQPISPRNFLENKSIIPKRVLFVKKLTLKLVMQTHECWQKRQKQLSKWLLLFILCLNAVCEMLLNVVICVLYGNIVYNAQHFTLVMRWLNAHICVHKDFEG